MVVEDEAPDAQFGRRLDIGSSISYILRSGFTTRSSHETTSPSKCAYTGMRRRKSINSRDMFDSTYSP